MDGVAATAALSGGCGGKVRSAAATGVVESGGTAKSAANEGAKGSELERARILGGEAKRAGTGGGRGGRRHEYDMIFLANPPHPSAPRSDPTHTHDSRYGILC